MTRTTHSLLLSIVAIALAAAALGPSAARADHNLYVGAGVGGSVLFASPGPTGGGSFVIREEFGWHPMGDAQGFVLGLTIGAGFSSGWYLTITPRIGYDIEVFSNRDFAFQLGPYAQLPGVIMAGPYGNAPDVAAFDMAFGLDLRFLVANRDFTIFVRPLGFDIGIGGNGALALYEGLVGVQHNFL